MTLSGKSVLVVDDLEELREFYVFELESLGYEVGSAATSKEARSALEEKVFDLVWLDLQLDGDEAEFEGHSLLRFIRQLNEGTQILVVSRHDSHREVRKAMKQKGADDFISKTEIDHSVGLEPYADFLEDLVAASTISEPVELDKVNRAYFESSAAVAFETTRIGSCLGLDAKRVNSVLLGTYNAIHPAFRLTSAESAFSYPAQEEKQIIVGDMWSKKVGSAVRIFLNSQEADGRTIYKRNKPMPLIIVKSEGKRKNYLE